MRCSSALHIAAAHMQGSVPKSLPAPSGLFIPEPLQFDFARDVLPQSANNSGPAGDTQALQAAMSTAWQPQFTWQGRIEMPASYSGGTEDPARACQAPPRRAHPHALRDPFKLIPNAAFEQMPSAALLTDSCDSQTGQLQQQHQGYALPKASACSSQEGVKFQGQSSWQSEVNRFESMRESMHQRPTWKAPEAEGNLVPAYDFCKWLPKHDTMTDSIPCLSERYLQLQSARGSLC